jgi:low temperature requirement protein LtrA
VLERIRAATADERGQIGRDISTYLHLPIIAGIVLVAVGDELVIAHPRDDLHDAGALVTLGGAALFLGGLMACAARLGQAQSLPRLVAVAALLAAVPLAARADGLLVAALLTALLALLVVAEQSRGRTEPRGQSHAAPGPVPSAAPRLPIETAGREAPEPLPPA